MHRLTLPIVAAHDGEVVKREADNLLAVFDDPERAVEAAVAMIQATGAVPVEGGPSFRFSIGIDYGELLLINDVDCFGDAVNLAHKLGEDIARPGEVLITQRVREQLKQSTRFNLREMPLSISGMELVAYCVTEG